MSELTLKIGGDVFTKPRLDSSHTGFGSQPKPERFRVVSFDEATVILLAYIDSGKQFLKVVARDEVFDFNGALAAAEAELATLREREREDMNLRPAVVEHVGNQ